MSISGIERINALCSVKYEIFVSLLTSITLIHPMPTPKTNRRKKKNRRNYVSCSRNPNFSRNHSNSCSKSRENNIRAINSDDVENKIKSNEKEKRERMRSKEKKRARERKREREIGRKGRAWMRTNGRMADASNGCPAR